MFRSRAVSLLLVGLFVWVTACTSYKQIEIGEVADHGKVRITLTDGERETVREPWVEGDSIMSKEASAIALAEVVELQAVGTDEVGTVALALLGVVALGMLLVIATCTDKDSFGPSGGVCG